MLGSSHPLTRGGPRLEAVGRPVLPRDPAVVAGEARSSEGESNVYYPNGAHPSPPLGAGDETIASFGPGTSVGWCREHAAPAADPDHRLWVARR
jgi:hypothetical protein